MMFNFFANQHLFYALAAEDTRPLEQALEATRKIPDAAQWAVFLRNHDELDIERLPEKLRAKVFERFGPDPRHAAVSPRHPPAAGLDARRSPSHRAGEQRDVLACRDRR